MIGQRLRSQSLVGQIVQRLGDGTALFLLFLFLEFFLDGDSIFSPSPRPQKRVFRFGAGIFVDGNVIGSGVSSTGVGGGGSGVEGELEQIGAGSNVVVVVAEGELLLVFQALKSFELRRMGGRGGGCGGRQSLCAG